MNGFPSNTALRALCTIPPLAVSASTALAVPEMPPQTTVTGDKEVDALIWLRQVIGTGNPALINKALQAAKRIKTPMKELETRYQAHLMKKNPGSLFAALSSIGFGELEELATRSIEKVQCQEEARSRFGGEKAAFADTAAETFCATALKGLKRKAGEVFLDDAKVDQRFNAQQELMPASLADCLHELRYWNNLYRLRNSFDGFGDPSQQVSAREDFVMRCMGRIPPASRAEALEAFEYLQDEELMDRAEIPAILLSLIKGTELERGHANGREVMALLDAHEKGVCSTHTLC